MFDDSFIIDIRTVYILNKFRHYETYVQISIDHDKYNVIYLSLVIFDFIRLFILL